MNVVQMIAHNISISLHKVQHVLLLFEGLANIRSMSEILDRILGLLSPPTSVIISISQTACMAYCLHLPLPC